MSLGLPFIQPRKAVPTELHRPILRLRTGVGMLKESGGIYTPAALGDPVAVWQDQSGAGRHARQATFSKRPLLTASGLSFDGTDDLLLYDGALLPRVCTAFAVVQRVNGPTGYQAIINGKEHMIFAHGATANWGSYASGDLSSGRNINNVLACVMYRRDNANTVTLATNGADLKTFASQQLYNFTTENGIGGRSSASQWFRGFICEIAAYDVSLPAAECAKIAARLVREHRVTV